MTESAQRRVMITGATSGFGEACARRFASAGCNLVLFARRMDRLAKLKESLPVPVHIVKLDVRDRRSVERTLESLPPEFLETDILINNAGLSLGLEPAYQAQLDDWETMVDTNIKGVMYFTRLVLPGMVERNRGHIINIGSVAAGYPYPGGNVYGATKAFVKQFSLNLKADLLGTPVRVTDIEPGLAETEFSLVRFKGDVEKAEGVYRGTKPISAEDLAEIIFWVSNLPDHININLLEVMPVCQAFGFFAIDRKS
ncbi:MAG: SDR family oxidoreductase [Desulfatiglandales bacterium]